MKKIIFLSCCIALFACEAVNKKAPRSTPKTEIQITEFPEFTKANAEQLASLPLVCIQQEYPNKLGQVLASQADLATPKQLRPAFYGCFDWHSAVHGHWSLVVLLKKYPNLSQAEEIKELLKNHLSKEHIQTEIAFFKTEENASFERTYGWAWLFQLATELQTWDDEISEELLTNLMPLVEVLEEKMMNFLPKLVYPIRVGEHSNTAFALSLSYDYAIAFQKKNLQDLIEKRAKDYYLQDVDCPLEWEPSGYDFLSPCLEEAKLMAKILSDEEFSAWLKTFLPELFQEDFQLNIAEVSDRSDGKLVHLDGLNFSRAWNLFELAKHPQLKHLTNLGNQHFMAAYPNLVGDAYEGSHWLGSFALYAINKAPN
mgnify:FL=1